MDKTEFIAIVSEEDGSIARVLRVQSEKGVRDFEADYKKCLKAAADEDEFELDDILNRVRASGYEIEVIDYAHVDY